MAAQRTFNALMWPLTHPTEGGKVDIRLGPTAPISNPPHTGDKVVYSGVTYYFDEQGSPTAPGALVQQLTDGVTTYTAPQSIADVSIVATFTGVGLETLCGVVHAIAGRLKPNS